MFNVLSRPLGLGAGFALLTCVLIAGCSKPIGTVSGHVSYKGKPLKGGAVTLINTEGGTSKAGTINEDGTYTISDVTGGNYKVCVDTSSLRPQQGPPRIPAGGQKAKTPAGDQGLQVPEGYTPSSPAAAKQASNAKLYVPIPASYAIPDQTDLKITVTGGSQQFDIELK